MMMLMSLILLFFITGGQSLTLTNSKVECKKFASNSNPFNWINTDGSLKYVPTLCEQAVRTNNDCTDDSWQALGGCSSCRFCASNATLFCEGQEVYTLPMSASIPTNTISLYKLSGVGLISLPPKSFFNLTIGQLIIENSNLTYISADAFHGVNAIKSIQFSNNTLDSLTYMDQLLHDMNYLKEINLRHNGLRILSSTRSANLKRLEYLSLAGNPIHNLDVYFLKNSSLRFLDLRNVKFKFQHGEFKDSGFSMLPNTLSSIDLSGAEMHFPQIQTMFKQLSGKNVSTVSFAFMSITEPPSCENLTLSLLHIKDSLEYLSMEGIWKDKIVYLSLFDNEKQRAKFESRPFKNIKELVLKNNYIIEIKDGGFFNAFPNLKSLSLAGCSFLTMISNPFVVLKSLSFIDFSNSTLDDVEGFEYASLNSIKHLDFSHSKFTALDAPQSIFNSVQNLEKLSFCDCGFPSDINISFKTLTKLKHLDISGTILPSLIPSLNESFTTGNMNIEELLVSSNGFTDNIMSMFSSLEKLKILDLSKNIIKEIPQGIVGTSLQKLNLGQNFIGTWYSSIIPPKSNMKNLDLSDNQITFVSSAMLEDFYSSSLVNLNNNPLLCNDEMVAIVCATDMNKTVPKTFTLAHSDSFNCYNIPTGDQLEFSQLDTCANYYKIPNTTTQAPSNRSVVEPTSLTPRHVSKSPNLLLFYVLLGVVVCVAVLSVVIALNWLRIKLRIHRFLSLRRARLLKKEAEPLDKHQTQYDVFVSYSDVDRGWVLDHLVPNLEKEGDVSLCFHERDFQVGLGILENIIECMDRSHSLLLVVSSAFVRSKWCQFEMHLAQYRLIETFRDQLVLVMLEDIPRKIRPQTLHHLMMTKTYLIWPRQPSNDDATELFWRRLKRALKPASFYNIFSTDS